MKEGCKKGCSLVLAAVLASSAIETRAAPPDLVPGVWKKISPPEAAQGYGGSSLVVDPSNPDVLYLPLDMNGLWKSSDRGSTWTRLGNPAQTGFPVTQYLDSPSKVAVDPGNPLRLYATQGVRGVTQGFWISGDGGATWTVPQGFRDLHVTLDITSLSVDPADFNHFILGAHSFENPGVLESTDGGATFVRHPPVASWPGGSMGLNILSHPASGNGDGQTWLVGTDGNGFWRSTDGGGTWNEVFVGASTRINVPHGGHRIYYTSEGVLYAGATPYPVRSFDNGAHWEYLTDLGFSYYFSVHGDGTRLYTHISYPSLGGFHPSPMAVSLETDGMSWEPYQGGAQTFTNGPFSMAFDPVNRIMYGAMWNQGLWALRVIDSSGAPPAPPTGLRKR